MVGDRDPMGIAAEIGQYGFWPAKGRFGIDHPFGFAKKSEPFGEGGGVGQSFDILDGALRQVSTQRGELGAVSNRIDSTVNNLTNIVSNLQAGRGRIQDADFAAETTNLAKTQIFCWTTSFSNVILWMKYKRGV